MRVHISAKHKHLTPKNIGGHVTQATPPFVKIFGYVRTVPGNTFVKFQVRSFNLF